MQSFRDAWMKWGPVGGVSVLSVLLELSELGTLKVLDQDALNHCRLFNSHFKYPQYLA